MTREQKIRRAAFYTGIFVLVWMFGLNYAAEWLNAAMLSYLVLVILCVLIVGFSIVWWWKTDGTSVVFRMLVLLAFGLGLDAAVQGWSRYLWLSGQSDRFDLFRSGWLWDYRQMAEIVALIYLLAVIISRMTEKRGHYVP